MDPRTFLRPAQVQVRPAPQVGDPAPETPSLSRGQGQPRLVAFLRHVGCPFAEATMRQLSALSLAHPGIEWVAVTHAGPGATIEVVCCGGRCGSRADGGG